MLSVKIETPGITPPKTGAGLPRDHPVQELDAGDDVEPDEERLIKQLWPDQATYQPRSRGGLRF